MQGLQLLGTWVIAFGFGPFLLFDNRSPNWLHLFDLLEDLNQGHRHHTLKQLVIVNNGWRRRRRDSSGGGRRRDSERWKRMRRRRRSSKQSRGRVQVVVVVRSLAMSVVTEGGAGVLEIHGVRKVLGSKGVACKHCLFHVELLIFALSFSIFD